MRAGPEVFNFTIKEIPSFIKDHMQLADKKIEDYDYILLHQANLFMLNHIYKKTGANEHQKFMNINKYGNTSSATLPLLLTNKDFDLSQSSNLLLAGFGVGLSWGGMGAIGSGIKNLLSLSSGSLSMDIKSFIVSLFSKPLISGLSIIGLSVIEGGGGGGINSESTSLFIFGCCIIFN